MPAHGSAAGAAGSAKFGGGAGTEADAVGVLADAGGASTGAVVDEEAEAAASSTTGGPLLDTAVGLSIGAAVPHAVDTSKNPVASRAQCMNIA